MCGDCCRNLREAGPRRSGDPERLAPRGLYPLETQGGLPVWSWERVRMDREAIARGVAPYPFVPSIVVVDEKHKRVVTLLHALDVDDCPNLGPGITEGTLVCGAYEARPLVCRAFPLVATGGSISPSSHCPEVRDAPRATPEVFAEVFGDESYQASSAAGRIGGRVAATLAFLETAGVIELARGLSEDAVRERLASWPRVEWWHALEGSGVVDARAWWASLQPDGVRIVTPAP